MARVLADLGTILIVVVLCFAAYMCFVYVLRTYNKLKKGA